MLDGNVIVITGAAEASGTALVDAMAKERSIVVATDNDRDRLADLGERCLDYLKSGHLHVKHLDITRPESVKALIAECNAEFGKIDGLVNNAYPRNAGYGRKLEDVSHEDFCDNVTTHLGGYFLVSQQFCSFFKRQGNGTIVNLSSIYGVISPRFDLYQDTDMTMPVEYAAIKSAVLQLTRYFAQYFKKDGIRVNAVSPGGILDDQPQSFLDCIMPIAVIKVCFCPQTLSRQ